MYQPLTTLQFADLMIECDNHHTNLNNLDGDVTDPETAAIYERLMSICYWARSCHYAAVNRKDGPLTSNVVDYVKDAAALYAKAQGVMKAYCLDDDPDDFPENYPPL